jgi:hypothetical protein
VSSKSCDSNEVLKLASYVDCSISGSNPKVDFHVPKLYHNPQVDSEVLKMVLDVNSDILGSNQKVVMNCSWITFGSRDCLNPPCYHAPYFKMLISCRF